jgi:hypothetical protein
MSTCYGSIGILLYLRLIASAAKVKLPSGVVRAIWFLLNFGLKVDRIVAFAAFMMVGGAVMLVLFLFQQMHNIGRNLTQIELDKIDSWRRHNKGTYVHIYDRGFWQNWVEFLLPPLAAKHEPIELMEVGPNPVDEDDAQPVEQKERKPVQEKQRTPHKVEKRTPRKK